MRLENYCVMPEKDLMYLLARMPGASHKNGYVFINNCAPVLAVCHCDVVDHANVDFAETYSARGHHFVNSIALDDRLGIWLLMEFISKRVDIDILITTGEEVGASTAFEFSLDHPGLSYNWIVEFDRRGCDYVTYNFSNSQMDKQLKKIGLKKGHGSFSDICLLDDYGVMAINIGIGYHNEHTKNCYVDMDDTMSQANKFLRFYRAHKDTKFNNLAKKVAYKTSTSFGSDWDDWEGYRPSSRFSDLDYYGENARYCFDDVETLPLWNDDDQALEPITTKRRQPSEGVRNKGVITKKATAKKKLL